VFARERVAQTAAGDGPDETVQRSGHALRELPVRFTTLIHGAIAGETRARLETGAPGLPSGTSSMVARRCISGPQEGTGREHLVTGA
jgi:hypothetical protein